MAAVHSNVDYAKFVVVMVEVVEMDDLNVDYVANVDCTHLIWNFVGILLRLESDFLKENVRMVLNVL